jgi:SAM-dependent methyltransferase
MAQAFGCQAYGTELSRVRLQAATMYGISVIAGDEIGNAFFDFVNAEQVIEHLAEPVATLKSLAASLAPDGLLKISVPDGTRIPELLRRPDWGAPKGSPDSLNAIAPLEHVNCFNRRALLELARNARLTPVEIEREAVIDVVRKRDRVANVRAALGRAKRAIRGMLPSFSRPRGGTSLFFRRSPTAADAAGEFRDDSPRS